MSLLHTSKLIDENGNYIASHMQTDGDYHLGVSMSQDVFVDEGNSSTENLTSANSYTFTGTSASTLGVVGLQWSLKTDQNATVYIEESPNGINWDISYPFDYIASKGGRGGTVQATQAYWRIRVVLTGTIATTYFRLDGVLCPIATPLPSALSPDGRVKSESTLTGKENTDRHVFISPLNSLTTNETVRLVGSSFDGTTKDTNFWTQTVTNGGTVVQVGTEVVLSTNTSANGSAIYQSVQRARFVISRPLKFFGFFAMATDPQTNNLRRIGAYDVDNGFFFQFSGTDFGLGTRKGTVDTIISNGSLNGNYGDTWNPLADETYYNIEIEYGAYGVNFYVNSVLLHTLGIKHWVNAYTLPVRMENINSNGNVTNNIMDCMGAVILGQGKYETAPIYKYIAGASTTIMKRGAGVLHTIVNNDNAGSVIVYDNTAGSGTIIASTDLTKALGTLAFKVTFNVGLTAVTTGAVKVTFVYE